MKHAPPVQGQPAGYMVLLNSLLATFTVIAKEQACCSVKRLHSLHVNAALYACFVMPQGCMNAFQSWTLIGAD